MTQWQFIEHGDGGCSWRNAVPVELNVVFVHGFHGDHLETWSWRPKRRFLKKGEPVRLFDLLTGDDTLPPCHFFSIAHHADIGSATGIDQAANWLRTFLRNHVPPDAPIVLIAHSFGGLACRRAIVSMLDEDDDASPVIALLMMGTPNSGTDMARVAKTLGSRAGSDMRPFNDKIMQLNRDWTARVVNGGDPDRNPAQRDPLLCRTVIGTQDRVVPEASAVTMASFSTIETLPKGHIDLVKARDRNDTTYAPIARFIRDAAVESRSREAEFALRHLTHRLRKVSLAGRWVCEERESITLRQDADDAHRLVCVAINRRIGGPLLERFNFAVWVSGHRPSGTIHYDCEIGQGVMGATDFNQLLRAANGRLGDLFKVNLIGVRQGDNSGAYELEDTRSGSGWAILSFKAPAWLTRSHQDTRIDIEIETVVDRRQGWFFYALPRTVSRRLEIEFTAPFRYSLISRLGRGSKVDGPTAIGDVYTTKAVVEGPTAIGRSVIFIYEQEK